MKSKSKKIKRSDYVKKITNGYYFVDLEATGVPKAISTMLEGPITLKKCGTGYDIYVGKSYAGGWGKNILDAVKWVREKTPKFTNEYVHRVCKPMIQKQGFVDIDELAKMCHLNHEAAQQIAQDYMANSGVVQQKYCVIDMGEVEPWRLESFCVMSHNDYQKVCIAHNKRAVCVVDNVTHAVAKEICGTYNNVDANKNQLNELTKKRDSLLMSLGEIEDGIKKTLGQRSWLMNNKKQIEEKYMNK